MSNLSEKEIINYIKNIINATYNDYISKDKIRDKIEQIKKEKENVIEEVNFKVFYRITDLKEIEMKVLQELLEEE